MRLSVIWSTNLEITEHRGSLPAGSREVFFGLAKRTMDISLSNARSTMHHATFDIGSPPPGNSG